MDCLNLGIPFANESSPPDWGDIDVSKGKLSSCHQLGLQFGPSVFGPFSIMSLPI